MNSSLTKNPIISQFLHAITVARTKEILERVYVSIKPKDSIIDIGCGFGSLSAELLARKHSVVSYDVADTNLFKEVTPIIYNGTKLPEKTQSFDVALLITVLHHTPDPSVVLQEATRVAKRVIIMEDVYSTNWQRYATYVMDSVLNLEFFGHPHTNKSTKEWKQLFKDNQWKLIDYQECTFWWIFKSGVFVIESSE